MIYQIYVGYDGRVLACGGQWVNKQEIISTIKEVRKDKEILKGRLTKGWKIGINKFDETIGD